MHFTLKVAREEDGRSSATISELPGVMQYGQTRSPSSSTHATDFGRAPSKNATDDFSLK